VRGILQRSSEHSSHKEPKMYETVMLNPKAVIITSDSEEELSEIMDLVTRKDREKNMKSFLDFAASIRKDVKDYKFNREQCYEE
jgi:hypothetical protein